MLSVKQSKLTMFSIGLSFLFTLSVIILIHAVAKKNGRNYLYFNSNFPANQGCIFI